jgi:hypothetical protein
VLVNGQVVPFHAMKAHMGSRGVSTLFLNFGTRWMWVVNFMPWPHYLWGNSPVPIEWEVGWAVELVWMFCIRDKSLVSAGSCTLYFSANSLVTELIMLSLFCVKFIWLITHFLNQQNAHFLFIIQYNFFTVKSVQHVSVPYFGTIIRDPCSKIIPNRKSTNNGIVCLCVCEWVRLETCLTGMYDMYIKFCRCYKR